MNFDLGMRRLAVFAGVLGAISGGIYAYRVLQHVPSERYQHKAFEKLAASDMVKQDQSVLRSAKEHGAIPDGPISSELLHPKEAIQNAPWPVSRHQRDEDDGLPGPAWAAPSKLSLDSKPNPQPTALK
jgi:hypothetical protein